MTVMSMPLAAVPSPLFRECRAALGDRVLRLQDEPLAILKALYRLGSLVVTTFSGAARVSQNMHYPALQGGDWYLESVGRRCRLRQTLDVQQWHSVLAVLEPTGALPARSLLFFDRQGRPLQQMAAAPETGGLAFEELVCAMLHPDQSTLSGLQALSSPSKNGVTALSVLLSVLERDWAGCADEDSFARLLGRCGESRERLYRSVRDSFACAVSPATLPAVLRQAAEEDASTTLCMGNQGVRLCMTAPWSAPRWQNRHCHLAHNGALVSLDLSRVSSLWRLRKPGDGQVVTALEALDEAGQWLWTLSAGDGNERQWRQLLGRSVSRDLRPT